MNASILSLADKPTEAKPEAKYLCVHLGDKEWGNETMARVAAEHFAADPSLTVVEVYEHGGWFLQYRRDGRIVGTANDMARFDADIDVWRTTPRNWTHLPTIRRP